MLQYLMQHIRQNYGNVHISVLLRHRMLSTIKNEDDREEVAENFWAWKNGKIQNVRNRIPGMMTVYYPLESVYRGGHMVSGVLITEMAQTTLPKEVIVLFSMISTLMVQSENIFAADRITRLPCTEELLEGIKKEELVCVAFLRFRDIAETSYQQGWITGNHVVKKCVQECGQEELYCISRDTFGLILRADIADAYGYVLKIYQKIEIKPDILIAEVTEPKTWDMVEYMCRKLIQIRGISILYMEKNDVFSEQMLLSDLLGTPQESSYVIRQMTDGRKDGV